MFAELESEFLLQARSSRNQHCKVLTCLVQQQVKYQSYQRFGPTVGFMLGKPGSAASKEQLKAMCHVFTHLKQQPGNINRTKHVWPYCEFASLGTWFSAASQKGPQAKSNCKQKAVESKEPSKAKSSLAVVKAEPLTHWVCRWRSTNGLRKAQS